MYIFASSSPTSWIARSMADWPFKFVYSRALLKTLITYRSRSTWLNVFNASFAAAKHASLILAIYAPHHTLNQILKYSLILIELIKLVSNKIKFFFDFFWCFFHVLFKFFYYFIFKCFVIF